MGCGVCVVCGMSCEVWGVVIFNFQFSIINGVWVKLKRATARVRPYTHQDWKFCTLSSSRIVGGACPTRYISQCLCPLYLTMSLSQYISKGRYDENIQSFCQCVIEPQCATPPRFRTRGWWSIVCNNYEVNIYSINCNNTTQTSIISCIAPARILSCGFLYRPLRLCFLEHQ